MSCDVCMVTWLNGAAVIKARLAVMIIFVCNLNVIRFMFIWLSDDFHVFHVLILGFKNYLHWGKVWSYVNYLNDICITKNNIDEFNDNVCISIVWNGL